MGYLYLILTTVMFSLIGTFVTMAKSWVSSDVISFSRFFFGVLFLVAYMLLTRKKISLRFTGGAIWLGVVCKCVNYLLENYAISHGYSFGNIIAWPVQCVALLFFSLFFLHEKISPAAICGVILCVVGVGVISLNGQSITEFTTGAGLVSTILFLISGTGAAGFTMAQKMLLDKMDTCNLNLSMFLLSAVITGVPLPFTAEFTGEFSAAALIGLIMSGFVTCAAFLLTAEAMKTLPVFFVSVVQSMCVILTLLWAVLFFHEPVTGWIVAGTLIFIVGMVLVNLKKRTGKSKS